MRLALFLLTFAVTLPALGQFVGQGFWPQVDEAQDFGVPPSTQLRLDDHAAPTPLEIPGARIVTTAELRRLLQGPAEKRPLLFDAMGEERHPSLPGAIWLPGAGHGTSFNDEIQVRLGRTLEVVTGGDRARTLIFFCAGPRCWLSYNVALRAARLGYPDVRWYRGGVEAWGAGGGALTEPRVMWQKSGTGSDFLKLPIRVSELDVMRLRNRSLSPISYFCLRTASIRALTVLNRPSPAPTV